LAKFEVFTILWNNEEMKRLEIILLAMISIGVLTNLIILDLAVFNRKASVTIPVSSSSEDCGQTCISEIEETVTQAIASLSAYPIPTKAPTAKTTTTLQKSEQYIPMGTGATTNDEWEDMLGTDIFVDTANYGTITQTYFEASLWVPTKNGTVYARLYNVTDKHPVWFSDISTESEKSTRVQSAKITLDPGGKVYRVQMRSSLRYPSNMDLARIKIISLRQ
jgi:hypothetical protein